MSKGMQKKGTIKYNTNTHKSIQSQKDIVADFCLLPIKEPLKYNEHRPMYSPAELTHNLDVVTSKPYQDLVAKLRILKSEKDQIVSELRQEKKERKNELKSLYKDKTKVKLDIWEKIGKICKLKDEISTEK